MLRQEGIINNESLLKNNKILISGEKGCGKTTLAYEIIKNDIEKNNPKFSHTFPDNYIDFHFLLGNKLEDIKELISKINKKPHFDKFYILIDQIDKVTMEGQSALLKFLEDRDDLMIVMTSNDNNRVLSTIHSRVININPIYLKNDDMLSLIKDRYSDLKDDEFINIIVELSQGCIGYAYEIIEKKDFYKELLKDLQDKNQHFYILSQKYNTIKDDGMLDSFLLFLERWITYTIIKEKSSYQKYIDLFIEIQNLKKQLVYNININLMLQKIFIKLNKL